MIALKCLGLNVPYLAFPCGFKGAVRRRGKDMKAKTRTGITGALLMLIAALALLVPSAAWAVEADQPQLSVVLQSDGDAYASGDVATFDATIQNTSDAIVDEVEYAYSVPDGMTVVEGSALSGSIGSLEPGEIAHAILKVNVDALVQPLPGASDGLASTGEAPIAAIICAVSLAALIAAMVASKKVRNVGLSLILVCGLTGMLGTVSLDRAYADRAKKSAAANCAVSVNGDDVTMGITVSYLGATSQGGAGDADDPTDSDEPTITRAQWVNRLLATGGVQLEEGAQHPYTDIAGHEFEAAIATAYDQGVIPGEATTFEPDAPATREFALATAVLASGFSDDGSTLEASDATKAEYPALLAIAIDLGMTSLDDQGNINPKKNIDEADASKILGVVTAILNPGSSSGGNVAEIEYKDDVVVVSDYAVEGGAIVIDPGQEAVSVGGKVAFLPTETLPNGAAGEVTKAEPQEDGSLVVSFEQATNPADILATFELVQSDVLIDMSNAVLEEGFELVNEPSVARASGSTGELKVKLPTRLGLDGEITFEGFYDTDIKWDLFNGFRRCKIEAGINSSMEVSAETGFAGKEADIKVATVTVPIAAGFGARVELYLHASLEGSISLEMRQVVGLELKGDHWRTYTDGDTEPDIGMEAEAKLGVAPTLGVTALNMMLVDVSLETGASVKGSSIIRDTGMNCADVAAYLYLTVAVGEHSELCKLAKLTFSKDLWTEKNSPLKYGWHWEDGVRVDECTYGKGEGGDPEPGEPGGEETPANGFIYEIGDYIAAGTVNFGDSLGEGTIVSITHRGYGTAFEGTIESTDPSYNGGSTFFGNDCGHGVYIMGYEGDSDRITIPDTIDGVAVVYASIQVLTPNTTVDVSQCKSLKSLTVLDAEGLTFGSVNGLLDVTIQGGTYAASIDMGSLSNLEALTLYVASLNGLEVNKTSLKSVSCLMTSGLERLDVSNASLLENLEVGLNSSLKELDCSNCNLADLGKVELSGLEVLNCSGNKISDLSKVEEWLSQPGHSGEIYPQHVS